MADRWAAHGLQNIDDMWCTTNNGVQDVFPDVTDDLIIDFASADVTFNVDFTAASLTIIQATLTIDGDREFTGDLTLAGGGLIDDGYTFTVRGDVTYASGVYLATGTLAMGSNSELRWNTKPQAINDLLIVEGFVASVPFTDLIVNKFTNNGTLDITNAYLVIFQGAVGWWGSSSGVIIGNGALRVEDTSNAPGNDVVFTTATIEFRTYGTDTIVMDANFDAGSVIFNVKGMGVGDSMTLDMNNHSLRCGLIGTIRGTVYFGDGICLIGGIRDLNAVHLGSSYVENTGTFDGANIAFTADDGASHIEGGTIQNCGDPGGAVHCHNAVDGGGNHSDFTFDEHAPPGSASLMGVGV